MMQFAISSLPCSELQFSYAASSRLSRLRVSWPLDFQVKHWQLVTCTHRDCGASEGGPVDGEFMSR